MKEFGKAMRAARKAKRLSMEALAEKSGVAIASIVRYERGEQSPGLFNLVCLADTLGITIEEYIGRENPKNEELKFTREFIHEHGLEFALAEAWNRRTKK